LLEIVSNFVQQTPHMKNISIGDKYPEIVNVLIEIEKGGHNKYEYDDDLELIKLDRVLHSPLFFPADYGFIPKTTAEDGDHSDILVITDSPTFPGCLVEARIIGVMGMSDENGIDQKIIAVPNQNPHYQHVNDIKDLEPHILKEIAHFFNQYKMLENKDVEVGEWESKEKAIELIKKAHQAFLNKS